MPRSSWSPRAQSIETEKFRATPAALRRLNDIAFSGDGEPTTYRNFDEIVAACADVKRRHGLDDVKMVLITNASMFHRPHVAPGLADSRRQSGRNLGQAGAGTEEYYQLVERTPIPFRQILGQHHGRRPSPAAGDPVAVHADSRRIAAAGRTK